MYDVFSLKVTNKFVHPIVRKFENGYIGDFLNKDNIPIDMDFPNVSKIIKETEIKTSQYEILISYIIKSKNFNLNKDSGVLYKKEFFNFCINVAIHKKSKKDNGLYIILENELISQEIRDINKGIALDYLLKALDYNNIKLILQQAILTNQTYSITKVDKQMLLNICDSVDTSDIKNYQTFILQKIDDYTIKSYDTKQFLIVDSKEPIENKRIILQDDTKGFNLNAIFDSQDNTNQHLSKLKNILLSLISSDTFDITNNVYTDKNGFKFYLNSTN